MRYDASSEKRKESSKREKFGCVPNQRYMLLRFAVLQRADRQTNAEFRAFSLSVVVSASAYTTTLSLLSTISIEQLI
ncbi:hypothetical protein Pyn_03717 [Prunus yedoensis var. nudiflora]|uniref:Uncharacterized protein n=1 Tax=Prunus yedoensis var. nudiflora TaxID=2094558 RepID=A0A314UNR8_PRUYE|nr:hypothetical protein Pyn_03717 [Prunus yedoensis var. nudiflora]